MFEIRDLPTLNACLNATSFVCLTAGFLFIHRARNVAAHKACMIAAAIASALFLGGYLTFHAVYGSQKYPLHDATRPLYFAVLLSHTILAVVNVPLVVLTFLRAFQGRLEAHKRIAKWTLPIWVYVSLTGIFVWWMLYVHAGVVPA